MKKRFIFYSSLVIALFMAATLLLSNHLKKDGLRTYHSHQYKTASSIFNSKKLIVGTTYNPVSYFSYQGHPIGFEYEILKGVLKKIGLKPEIQVYANEHDLTEALHCGSIDLAMNNFVTFDSINESNFVYTNAIFHPRLLLVHDKTKRYPHKKDEFIQMLKTKRIIIPSSDLQHITYQGALRYYSQFLNIKQNDSIGVFHALSDVINNQNVSVLCWDHLAAISDLANLEKVHMDTVGSSCNLSFLVGSRNDTLLTALNHAIDEFCSEKAYNKIVSNYLDKAKYSNIAMPPPKKKRKRGAISIYDDLFKIEGKNLGIDWQWVAAIGYIESKFNDSAVSAYGATGLMQLMPATGENFGATDLYIPEENVAAAGRYIKSLINYWNKKLGDSTELVEFVLASYNAGLAHVIDTRALAEKYNDNPDRWIDNCEKYILLKSDPAYYQDEVVKSGYCRGQETYNFVRNVTAKYLEYKERTE